MLPLLLTLSLATSINALTPLDPLCAAPLTPSPSPGSTTFYGDNDPNYVYPWDCSTTSQKIIFETWYNKCYQASLAACGALASVAGEHLSQDSSPFSDSWQFGWANTDGSACQASLYLPASAYNTTSGEVLSHECCMDIFSVMVEKLIATPTASLTSRMSVNIAEGGFPASGGFNIYGYLSDENGMQVDATLPSFVIQGITAQYPFSGPNCTAADIKRKGQLPP